MFVVLLSASVPASSTPACRLSPDLPLLGQLDAPTILFVPFTHLCCSPTRACRCVFVHFLWICIPTCRALVTVRTLALTNPGPPSSHAANPKMHRSGTVVLVPAWPWSSSRTSFSNSLLTSAHTGIVRSDDDIRLTAPVDVSRFFTCRPHTEVAMRHVESPR